MAESVTDIWFRTGLTLDRIAEAIGLADCTHDAEDHWEWVIGVADGLQLDVARTHKKDPSSTDTRIFRLDNQPFEESEAETLCRKLLTIAESDICLGQWQCLAGNKFDKIVLSRFNADRKSGELGLG